MVYLYMQDLTIITLQVINFKVKSTYNISLVAYKKYDELYYTIMWQRHVLDNTKFLFIQDIFI